jgi:hypothetical protein
LIITPPLSPKAIPTVLKDVGEANPVFEDVEEGELLRDFEGLKDMASSFVRKMEAVRSLFALLVPREVFVTFFDNLEASDLTLSNSAAISQDRYK